MSEPRKFYAAFIVSTKPINLGDLADNHAVTHLVNERFELKNNLMCQDDLIVDKAVPHHCVSKELRGRGKSVSLAILSWFESLCSSDNYLSLERKRKLAREEKDKDSGDE